MDKQIIFKKVFMSYPLFFREALGIIVHMNKIIAIIAEEEERLGCLSL